jgi:RES domain-containing protein
LTRVYRILRKAYSKRPLDGEGAFLFGGRWSNPGTRLAYTSEHLSLAMIEYLVHADSLDAPSDLVVIAADVPRGVSRISIPAKRLPKQWREFPAPSELAQFGEEFVRNRRAAVLIVPSALAPGESNWLINPRHLDFPQIRVQAAEAFSYDPRFFGRS